MCTVLITYSTPPPPSETTTPVQVGLVREATAPVPATAREESNVGEPSTSSTSSTEPAATCDVVTEVTPPAPSFAAATAGIDEAIAATIADELTRAGHRVACRPSVAVTTTDGFDLVLAVHRLRVSHRDGGAPQAIDADDPQSVEVAQGTRTPNDGESTIPMTWCADWRAVDAWARSVGDHLVHLLELRTELARVRAELDRCRTMLLAATPEPRALSAVELGRPVARGAAAHGGRRAHRLTPTSQTTGA
ncbi:hypothetical protein GCM10009721_19710 [Terrabacter tumescens]|uniref:Uncharacterized protein n=1 Tax=Terrabacter tumescens TaxID=60443 RepID=A0ABQ2HZ30_9MICO|nr:hypothetical protein [Terrabacter tumescens]GGM93725.1 hypothetical protein GCM10009721_19710 [Terrabacter tumescens]